MRNFSWIMAFIFYAGCGTETGNPSPSPRPPTTVKNPGNQAVVADSQVSSGYVSSTSGDALTNLNLLSEQAPASNATQLPLSFEGTPFLNTPENFRKRKCTANSDGSVTIERDASAARSGSKKLGIRGKFEWMLNLARNFQLSYKPGVDSSIACESDGQRRIVLWEKSTGLSITSSYNISRTFKADSVDRLGKTYARSETSQLKGKSTFAIVSAEVIANQGLLLQKKVTMEHSRTVRLQKADGTEVNLQAQVSTPQALVIKLKRNADAQGENWAELLIEKGEVLSSFSEGVKLSLQYENVQYKKALSCLPLEGKLFGKISSPSGEQTYTVQFGGETLPVVQFSTGETQPYQAGDCSE